MVVAFPYGLCALAASLLVQSNACTMMIAGRKVCLIFLSVKRIVPYFLFFLGTRAPVHSQATIDGSTMTTQTNDCDDCDFRMGLVPRANHTNDDKASIWAAQFSYPRYGENVSLV